MQVYISFIYTQFKSLAYNTLLALVSPSDFEALSEVLTFAPCDTQHCVNVVITDDLVNEPEETFYLSLTNISPFINLSTAAGEVLITDDDGKELATITDDDGKVLKAEDMWFSGNEQDFQSILIVTAVKCVLYMQKLLLPCSYLQISRKESDFSH